MRMIVLARLDAETGVVMLQDMHFRGQRDKSP
jgi:hypothetical protein